MRVLIACGGTAGHIYPGVALAEEIIAADKTARIIMVISSRPRDKELLKRAGSSALPDACIETIKTVGLPQKKFSLEYIIFIGRLVLALIGSLLIILRHRPRIAVGFGGYSSFAPLAAACLLRIPVIIHEQNVLLGKANRILAGLADKIAVSFPVADNLFPVGKVVRTGFPLRRHLIAAALPLPSPQKGEGKGKGGVFTKRISLPDERKLTVLAMGGSQGAAGMNRLVLGCLSQMERKTLSRLHFIHLSGKQDCQYVHDEYAKLGVDFQVFDFLEEMDKVYPSADILICRAGAGTIFEAALFGPACILIPYPHGNQHQQENAAYLAQRGCALVVEETAASAAAELQKALLHLFTNAGARQELSRKIGMLKLPQAGLRLKEQVDMLLYERI